MVSNIELAYIAGFVDGEGYIGIKKYIRDKQKDWTPMYSEKISVASINPIIINYINERFNGYVCFHKPSKLSKRGYWSWELTEKKAKEFIKKILPYLKIKEPEAKMVLLLSEDKEDTNSRKMSVEHREFRENLYLKIKNLHTYKI